MLYSLLKTLLFIRCHSKASAKSDCRLCHVCRCVQSLHMETLKLHLTDCHEIKFCGILTNFFLHVAGLFQMKESTS